MPVISLSTCWNSPRHTDGYEMIAEIAALGFENVELSHGIRLALVPGIMRALDEKLVTVQTTHNFCPLPPGVNSAAPNLFQPTSADERTIGQWHRYTRKSVDFARQVGAKLVVCHLGSIQFGFFNPAAAVNKAEHRAKAENGIGDLEQIQKAAADCVTRMKRKIEEPMNRLFGNLGGALEYARECGVLLGAEIREKCEELPLDEDFPQLFSNFGPESGLAYWHDTGHAHLKEKMGLIDHREHLKTHADRLVGFHVHDVIGFKDHLPPGAGEIDFSMIASFVKPQHLVTLELNPRLDPVEVVESREYIEKLLTSAGPAAKAS